MDLYKLKEYIVKNFPYFICKYQADNNLMHISLRHIDNTIQYSNDSILVFYGTTVILNDFIDYYKVEKLGYVINSQCTRSFLLDEVNETMIKLSLSFLSNVYNDIMIKHKQDQIKEKMENISKDFE